VGRKLASGGFRHCCIKACGKIPSPLIGCWCQRWDCHRIGRSIDSFNLYKALSRLTPLFQKFGGHAYAAGFRLDEENLEILKRELEGLAEKEMTEEDLVPTIEVDSDLFLKEIGHEMIDQIAALSPFGQENPEPVFRARSLHVSGSRVVGERHLKLRLRQGDTTLEAIAFGFGHHHPLNGKRVDIIFTPGLNRWQGSEKIQLKIVDFRECAA